jgi:tetratricopeptide (TPR) repeat protein
VVCQAFSSQESLTDDKKRSSVLPNRRKRRILAVAALLVGALAGQQRDLKVEKLDTESTLPPQTVKTPPRSYAVVIGIAGYPKLAEKYQLRFPERDAQSMNTILISPEGGSFKAENVRVLTGPQATLAAMRREIDGWLPSVAKEDDRVLIYFAGHGFLYGGKGYLAPSDFDAQHIEQTGYPMDELGSVIGEKIHATYKILLTDACHSGAITPEETQTLNGSLANLQKSLFSLTASRDRESSFESPDLDGGHGVFTYYVVEGMGGAADANRDGVVSADELAEYVHTQVREKTEGRQNPTSDRGSFDANLLLAYTPSTAKPGAPPAPKYGTLTFEANMDEVEVFVDGRSIGVLQKKGQTLSVPGLQPGEHTIKGVKMGYEPDGPRQETVYPGTESTVSIRILIPRRRSKAATDLLDKGIEAYEKGSEPNYRRAAENLEKALAMDPTYSQAAYYLGLTYNALFDEDRAEQNFRKAIAIDPDYLQARASYAGMLLDTGNVDEALRQVNTVLVRDPKHAMALTMQAQAYRFKELYAQSIESARQAIQLTPKNAEPHLWMADSLRLSGKLADARTEYDQYLKLSDFDSHLGGQLNYYVLGSLFGLGRKSHAAVHDIWSELRSLAYFGICDCERRLAHYDEAISACQRSLSYYSKDPFAHYALALSYMYKANQSNSVAELGPALKHFQEMLAINPDMQEAKFARQNIATIQKALAGQ